MGRAPDTAGDTIPPTIIGTEAEFTAQPLSVLEEPNIVLGRGLDAAGYGHAPGEDHRDHFLSNGAMLGTDTSIPGQTLLIKHASGEELGVGRAAASRQGASKLIRQVLKAAGVDFNRRQGVPILGRTGYAHDTSANKSTGPHTSFLYEPPANETLGTPYNQFVKCVATYLSTRHVLYGAGMLGEDFLLSQKGPHVQSVTPSREIWAPTKPLLTIHRAPKSYAKPHQRRIEDGGGDLVLSNWAAFVGIGTSAAFLHAMRYGRREVIDRLPLLHDPLHTLQEANSVAALDTPLPVEDGRKGKYKYMNIIDIQEAYLDFIAEVDAEHGLPADEKLALTEARNCLADLKMGGALLVDDRVEWAARLSHLQDTVDGPLTRSNTKAIAADLYWDIQIPKGPGVRYWENQYSMNMISQALIGQTLARPSPDTRAAWRAGVIAQPLPENGYRTVGWATIRTGNHYGTVAPLLTMQTDPYGTDQPFPITL